MPVLRYTAILSQHLRNSECVCMSVAVLNTWTVCMASISLLAKLWSLITPGRESDILLYIDVLKQAEPRLLLHGGRARDPDGNQIKVKGHCRT